VIRAQRGPLVQRELPEPLGQQGPLAPPVQKVIWAQRGPLAQPEIPGPLVQRELQEPLAPPDPQVQKEIRALREPQAQPEQPEPLGQQGRPEQQAQQDLRESSGLTFWAHGRPRSSIMLQRMML
jgi:hypothetical protein